jgi:hypothetical protein
MLFVEGDVLRRIGEENLSITATSGDTALL